MKAMQQEMIPFSMMKQLTLSLWTVPNQSSGECTSTFPTWMQFSCHNPARWTVHSQKATWCRGQTLLTSSSTRRRKFM